MENTENKTARARNYYISIMITQFICVLILLLSVICMKYFFKGTYSRVKEFYVNELCSDTDINEVLQAGDENNEI